MILFMTDLGLTRNKIKVSLVFVILIVFYCKLFFAFDTLCFRLRLIEGNNHRFDVFVRNLRLGLNWFNFFRLFFLSTFRWKTDRALLQRNHLRIQLCDGFFLVEFARNLKVKSKTKIIEFDQTLHKSSSFVQTWMSGKFFSKYRCIQWTIF